VSRRSAVFPKALADMAARVDDGAVDAGRDPPSVSRILNVNGEITTGDIGRNAARASRPMDG
jgi:hypothetical protein